MAKLVICSSCGAEFSNDEPKCPYCGTMNYEGAEKEYLEKLEDIREDVEELNAVPMQEAKKELKKQGRFIKRIVLVCLVLVALLGVIIYLQEKSYERDDKADFIWQEENYPIMDAMYEAGEYEELAEFYKQALEEDRLVYNWEHAAFIDTYIAVEGFYLDLAYMEEAEEEKEEIRDSTYTSILWNQWYVYGFSVSEKLSDEEKAYFTEAFAAVGEHLKNDWDFDEATFQEFADKYKEAYGMVSWDDCEAYIKKWKKGE